MKKPYDENQNPILALTGSLEDYKKELQETIKEQERLTKTQENALGNAGTARANEIKNGWTYSAPKLDKMNSAISGLKSAFGESTDMKTGLDNYVKFLTERNKAADEYNKELADKNVKFITDINVLEGNNVVKISNTKMKIRIALPENLKGYDKYEVVYILNNKIQEAIPATIEDGYIVFETSHFAITTFC